MYKFHLNLKFQEEIQLNSKPRNFFEFSFEIHFKSREFPMEKVVSFFKPFTTIFYLHFSKHRKIIFSSVKV
jgi:hypothetical protein